MMRRNKAAWIILLAACCVLPLQAVSADDVRYKPVPQSADMETVYITDVEIRDGHTYLTADPIQWYEGAAADEAFRRHEPDAGMDGAPDGYYIVNDVVDPHTYELAPDADILMQFYNRTGDWSEADIRWNEKIGAAKFATLFDPQDREIMEGFPYHVVVKNGKIVKIVQQYIP